MKKMFGSFLILFIISSMMLVGQGYKGDVVRDAQIRKLRDSLEAITYPIHKLIATNGNNVIIRIDNQDEWNALPSNLRKKLNNGINNITIEIAGKGIIFGETKNSIYGWDYPEANIKIIGTRSKMQAFGILIKEKEQISHRNGAFYVLAYDSFNLDDIITDERGHEISFKEEMKCIKGNIIKVQGGQDDLWKFKVELPNLTEEECEDFHVLMTRDWTSSRHKVEKVEDGWLYYHLDSEDLHSDINPNVDWTHYQVRPRYGFINNPTSKGIHIKGGKIYIPVRSKYGDIRI